MPFLLVVAAIAIIIAAVVKSRFFYSSQILKPKKYKSIYELRAVYKKINK